MSRSLKIRRYGGMNTVSRKAEIGERILITIGRVKWLGTIMYKKGDIGTVIKKREDLFDPGVFVKEWGLYVKHNHYRVIGEEFATDKNGQLLLFQ